MRFGGRQTVNQITRYNEFGGGQRNFLSRNTQAIMPDVGIYRINGTGRDTYIS